MLPPPESLLPVLIMFAVTGVIFVAIPAQIHGYWQRWNAFLGRPNQRVLHGFLPDSPQGVRVFGMVTVAFTAAMATLYLCQLSTLG